MQNILTSEAKRIAEQVANLGPDVLSGDLVWTEFEQNLYNLLLPHLTQLALFGVQLVQQRLGEQGVGINWNLANDRATEWARQYAGERSRTLTDTTRKQVANQIAEWTQASEGLPQLIERVGKIVSNPVRAEMIAITEATNTYAEANATAWTAAGYPVAMFKPAAHVRCRCYLQPYTLPNGDRVLVWYTARDELVCRQPLMVPWSGEPVQGCRALHTVVVSEGPYLGLPLSRAITLSKAN